MAIRNTLVLASSFHTRTKPQVLQLLQAFVSLKNFAQTVLLTLAFFHFALPLAHSHSVQHQSHSMILKSDKSRQDFYIHKKKGRGKKNTHRLTQYMQSEAVFFVDKAFTHGKWGTDTEICRTLLPMRRFLPGNWERVGELQKRFLWRRFQKTSNKN